MVEDLEIVDGGVTTKRLSDGEQHIRNRRLFRFAAGTIALAEWERDHLHGCVECQTMGALLVRSISRLPDLEFKNVRS
jgi:hypothetical protein